MHFQVFRIYISITTKWWMVLLFYWKIAENNIFVTRNRFYEFFFHVVWVIPFQSLGSHIRPQLYGLGLILYMNRISDVQIPCKTNIHVCRDKELMRNLSLGVLIKHFGTIYADPLQIILGVFGKCLLQHIHANVLNL